MKAQNLLTYFTLTLVLLFSCSSNDDSNGSSSAIDPPNWIIGTWLQDEPIDTGLGVKFTSNDLVLISSLLETSYKENIASVEATGENVITENMSTENTYKLTINYPVGSNLVFEFNKVSDTQITWVSSSNAPLNKQ